MVCPKCGSKMNVKDSRSLKQDDTLEQFGKGSLIYRVGKIITWYTQDFTARRKACKSCGHEFDSIELEVSDFIDVLKTVRLYIDDDVVEKIESGKLYEQYNDNK